MAYASLSDMGFFQISPEIREAMQSAMQAAQQVAGDVQTVHEQMNVSIAEPGEKSMFRPRYAADLEKDVQIKTALKQGTENVTLTVKLKNLMVPWKALKKVVQMARDARANPTALETRIRNLIKSDSPLTSAIEQSIEKELQGGYTGIMSFNGWGICKDAMPVYSPFAKARTPLEPMGKITIMYQGQPLGSVRYYFANPPLPSAPRLPFGADYREPAPYSIDAVRTSLLLKQFGESIGGWSSRSRTPTIPPYPPVNTAAAGNIGVAEFVDLFPHVYTYVTAGEFIPAAGRVNAIKPRWEYAPLVDQELTDYYNIADKGAAAVTILLEQGYENPDQELINRAKLKSQFPLNTCKIEWMRWIGGGDFGIVNRASADQSAMIANMVTRTPLKGMFFVHADDLVALKNAANSKGGMTFMAAKMALDDAKTVIEERELTCFNYNFYRYITVGASAGAVINKAVYEYNKRKERSAKRSAGIKLFESVLGTVLTVIPATMPIGLAFTAATSYGQIEQAKASARAEEKKGEALERELAKAETAVTEHVEQVAKQAAAATTDPTESAVKPSAGQVVKKVLPWAAGAAGIGYAALNLLGD